MMLLWGTQQLAVVAVSVPNYRSLGGIECAGGRVVRHNTILRSATPSNATAADVAYLRGTLSLASVVDLRAPEEALKDPGARRLPEKVRAAPRHSGSLVCALTQPPHSRSTTSTTASSTSPCSAKACSGSCCARRCCSR